jgi:predicted metal-dependent HD superfamily phosphohydrolase
MTVPPRTSSPLRSGLKVSDLRGLFHDTLAALKRNDPDEAAWGEIESRYQEPPRPYHSLAHIAHCLGLLAETPHDTPLLRLVFYYHDVIYDPCGDDNELQSARFATAQLAGLGLPDTATSVIYDLIRATDHRPGALAEHADLVCDVDLAILGAERPDYGAYAAAIRQEYAWVPDVKYRSGRLKVLESFHRRPAIYQTPEFKARFEARARENIAAEISALLSGRPFDQLRA